MTQSVMASPLAFAPVKIGREAYGVRASRSVVARGVLLVDGVSAIALMGVLVVGHHRLGHRASIGHGHVGRRERMVVHLCNWWLDLCSRGLRLRNGKRILLRVR